ncbi:hypothetical protein ACMGE9_04085 [Macrococcus sp. EM39E]|uniref:hypothetical protein n=1 Tax=Macrococcus animalis TaxID=3395467 RepID=UPI0039BDD3CC
MFEIVRSLLLILFVILVMAGIPTLIQHYRYGRDHLDKHDPYTKHDESVGSGVEAMGPPE